MSSQNHENISFDIVVIGSGFGGSVCAMRLAQKGYSVAILELGKRISIDRFPKTDWQLWRYFWKPIVKFFGPQRISLLKGVMVLHAAGVGGGSLVYANTLMKPPPEVFQDPSWPKGKNWQEELNPHYETAEKMLGVTTNPYLNEGEEVLKKIGEKMGVKESFHPTEVGVFFGVPGESVPDPYFSGLGPDRTGCISCGACMLGCRYNAKNTLDKNYLFFAEKWGAKIFPETKALKIIPKDESYQIETICSTSWFFKNRRVFSAKKVILSAGVLGTMDFLLKNREVFKTLPNLSSFLGKRVSTNGESLLGVTSFDQHRKLSVGISIGAAIHPNPKTKIEMVRFSDKSSFWRLLGVPLTPNGGKITRPMKALIRFFLRFPFYMRAFLKKNWANSSLILLVMQYVDNHIEFNMGRSIVSFFRKDLQGRPSEAPIPAYIPLAQESAKILSKEINGEPVNIASEALLSTPATAHILGGCRMGDSPEKSVIKENHEVFGYSGLYVCDGSVIPCNLAVNPSFTITALAERFASKFPKSENLSEEEYEKRKIIFGPKKRNLN